MFAVKGLGYGEKRTRLLDDTGCIVALLSGGLVALDRISPEAAAVENLPRNRDVELQSLFSLARFRSTLRIYSLRAAARASAPSLLPFYVEQYFAGGTYSESFYISSR